MNEKNKRETTFALSNEIEMFLKHSILGIILQSRTTNL